MKAHDQYDVKTRHAPSILNRVRERDKAEKENRIKEYLKICNLIEFRLSQFFSPLSKLKKIEYVVHPPFSGSAYFDMRECLHWVREYFKKEEILVIVQDMDEKYITAETSLVKLEISWDLEQIEAMQEKERRDRNLKQLKIREEAAERKKMQELEQEKQQSQKDVPLGMVRIRLNMRDPKLAPMHREAYLAHIKLQNANLQPEESFLIPKTDTAISSTQKKQYQNDDREICSIIKI